MISFFTEKEIAQRVKNLVSGRNDVSLAVAYWGDGAVEKLGLQQIKKGRVIVNLESGSSNPDEVEKLRDLKPNLNVRSLHNLHAKVYANRNCCILGSSNASANGLAEEGDLVQGLREANLECSQKAAVTEINEWFDQRWGEAIKITNPMLKAAQEKWSKRSTIARVQQVAQYTLLTACKRDRSYAAETYSFIFGMKTIVKKPRRATEARTRTSINNAVIRYAKPGLTRTVSSSLRLG